MFLAFLQGVTPLSPVTAPVASRTGGVVRRAGDWRKMRAAGALAIAVAAGVAASVMAPSAAMAQKPQTGTLVPGREGTSMVDEAGLPRSFDPATQRGAAAQRKANAEANETMRTFTTCLIAGTDSRREHEALVSFLKLSPEARGANALATRVSKAGCIRGTGADYTSVRFSDVLLRGGLFRALYLQQVNAPQRVRVSRDEFDSVWHGKGGDNHAGMVRYGDCVVGQKADAAAAFITAKVDSAEQGSALRQLGPALGACLQPGAKLTMSRMILEGTLSEALYRKVTQTAANGAGRNVTKQEISQ